LTQKKIIKNQIQKSFAQMINSLYPFFSRMKKKRHERWKTLTVIGIIIGTFGVIFHLQGQAIVGPESSFMYANPEWISYGLQIMILGIIILSVGFVILKKKLICNT
jgi:putative Mn2+ efflux pump MntP